MGEKRLHFEILDAKRRSMLPRLRFLRADFRFYLAGGTALALQIRHRVSVDFDFYSPREFSPLMLYRRLEKVGPRVSSLHIAEGTLMALVDGIEMSFFRYDYSLLEPLVYTEFIDLASLEDVAAMKLISIVQRGTRRDFVDVYFLLKRYRLEVLLRLTQKKYAAFNPYLGLRALTYFDDAEQDKSRVRLETFEKIEWDKVKETLIEVVDAYRKEHLRSR